MTRDGARKRRRRGRCCTRRTHKPDAVRLFYRWSNVLTAGQTEQVLYTQDVAQYAIGARAEANFDRAINKALQKREPGLLLELSG